MAPVKRQMGVALDDELRARLTATAAEAGRSIAEEIRQRLERTFAEHDYDAPTRRLVEAIKNLATLVRLQTGHDWHEHPAANRVLRHAITARLARLKPDGEPIFAPGELPTARLVAQGSDDAEAMGLGLEAVEFHTPPMTPERQQKLDQLRAETIAEIRKRHSKDKRKKT